jgi:PilX N-terminal
MTPKERGAALILAMMALALLAALGLSLAVLTSIEARVAGNYTNAHEAMAAAETALEFAAREILHTTDWSGVVAGSTRSVFVDGSSAGSRTLVDGSSVDLSQLTSGLGNPAWRLFAHGFLNGLENVSSTAYVVIWAAPHPPGQEAILAVRADAFGAYGTRRGVQATISRWAILSWSEVR